MPDPLRRLRTAALAVAMLALIAPACSSSGAVDSEEPPAALPAAPLSSPAAPADEPGCVSCHTDEEALRALAVEPPPTEVLSEGEG